jgi:hypothetical protein
MEEITDYKQLTNDELKTEYQKCLSGYREWVDKEFEFNEDWEQEIFTIVGMRDDLQELIDELAERGAQFDVNSLATIDNRWKAWIGKTKDPNFRFNFKRDDEPREKWWWWLDQ